MLINKYLKMKIKIGHCAKCVKLPRRYLKAGFFGYEIVFEYSESYSVSN